MLTYITFPLFSLFNQLFLFSNHPLSSTIIILIQTLLMCLLIGNTFYNLWFSYILFLVFLGGMLVLFIYTTSLTPNLLFSNQKFNLTIIIPIVFILAFYLFILLQLNISFTPNSDIIPLSPQTLEYELQNILNNMFCFPIFKLNWFLIIYLFITLIAVTKITNIFEGPLRKSS